MHDIIFFQQQLALQIERLLHRVVRPDPERAREQRDRGAVSLEQVLWFVAAGVSVAIIAGIIWNRISDEANEPTISRPQPPQSP